MVQGYYIEEVIEWALNYTNLSNPIGILKSHHEGSSQEKESLGRRL
jgi:hypothetical protein